MEKYCHIDTQKIIKSCEENLLNGSVVCKTPGMLKQGVSKIPQGRHADLASFVFHTNIVSTIVCIFSLLKLYSSIFKIPSMEQN